MGASTSSARGHLRDGLKDPLRAVVALPVGSGNGRILDQLESRARARGLAGPKLTAEISEVTPAQVESLFQENIKRIFIATIGRGDELDGLFVRIKRKSLKP
jgi:hypothetical protein